MFTLLQSCILVLEEQNICNAALCCIIPDASHVEWSVAVYVLELWCTSAQQQLHRLRPKDTYFFTNKNITTMERLYQGHLHPYLKHPETDMSRPGFKLPTLLHRRRALYQRGIRTAYLIVILKLYSTFCKLCGGSYSR
jgi:hypothetical protein